MQNLFSKKIFFPLFLPGAGLQINIECARKLLNYSCTELFKHIWERQSPWIYLLAQKLCVIYWQERVLHIHFIYLSVACLQVKYLKMHLQPLNFTLVGVCLSSGRIGRLLPPQLLKQRAEIHTVNIHEQTPIHHHQPTSHEGGDTVKKGQYGQGAECYFLPNTVMTLAITSPLWGSISSSPNKGS